MSARLPASLLRSRRGSILIVALLLCAIIALMLGSFLNLNLNSTHQAFRSFQNYAAMNLVEAGAEEALWSYNRAAAGHSDGWTGWTTDGTSAWRKFDGFTFTANTTGWVKVYVSVYQPTAQNSPKVVALASVNPPTGAPITRMTELTLQNRAYFANGLVAKDTITFSGSNVTVDSWNSGSATAPVPYSSSVRDDRGTVASTSVLSSAVLVNQADVWGYVYTGGAQPQVGANGSIRGANTPVGVAIDTSRIATDFNAQFSPVTAPTGGTVIATVGTTLGVAGTSTTWICPSLSLSGSKTLTILGNVTLILTAASGTSALSVTGNASIIIPTGSTLTIFTTGNIKLAGKGLANANLQPISAQFWGTNTTPGGQDIQIAGNGSLSAVIYAPDASVELNGNGAMMGAVVADTITLTGNAAFHYDESLANFGNNASIGVSKWRDLIAPADRSTYDAVFSGW
ncbi:MAG: hypothetical protein ACHQ4G_02625 [Opitutales bacterium]